ncbi:ABC transporter ATP-binding protein [Fodinicurvata sp. EGI_FJ10296]|uniref:ABC transporter ATP-binding protein n=1 Tax=Fodinicurvata sp. EGI_FJ10296 TaxID=3231908 RepID=UPI0034529E44
MTVSESPAGDADDALLETRGLTKSFGGVTAVADVDLMVRRGQLNAVVGPNGAGKTTLFHLLTGTMPATAGHVIFEGEDITRTGLSARVKLGIARSYQKTNIFPRLSVRQNILAAAYRAKGVGWTSMFGRRKEVEAAEALADRILGELDLADQAHKEAQTLPYGAQRLIDIGIALACEPSLLLLDEPTSGLSSGELQKTIAFISDLKSRYSILLIEHNMDLVLEFADGITVLNFGHVIARGNAAEISADEGVQEAYFGRSVSPEGVA